MCYFFISIARSVSQPVPCYKGDFQGSVVSAAVEELKTLLPIDKFLWKR